jgi:carboxypeptidase T
VSSGTGLGRYGGYAGAAEYENGWRELVARAGGREVEAGRSVEGRPIWRFELGAGAPQADGPRPPTFLLTGLIHGLEVIGSLALFEAVKGVVAAGGEVLERARLVIMPIVNPDALAANMGRLARGRFAWQRKNANGVDLNRNFPAVAARPSRHPLAGSRWRRSPWYRGPAPLSEPETRAVHDVAVEVRPDVALGFHSFGNLLLYPWAHTRAVNPRQPGYLGLASAFSRRLGRIPYRTRQAIDFYPTLGDLDDWLDARLGTLAFTVEVSGLDRRLLNPFRLVNPFCWMNPAKVEPTLANVSPGVVGLLAGALAGTAPTD